MIWECQNKTRWQFDIFISKVALFSRPSTPALFGSKGHRAANGSAAELEERPPRPVRDSLRPARRHRPNVHVGRAFLPRVRVSPVENGSMEVVRSLLRPPPRRAPASNPSLRGDNGGGASMREPGIGEQAPDWASPSFARVRARPSSLYTPLRSSPTFPLSHRHSSPSVAAASPDPERFHASQPRAIRSQSTHATQARCECLGTTCRSRRDAI
jgi:hypothetical protein